MQKFACQPFQILTKRAYLQACQISSSRKASCQRRRMSSTLRPAMPLILAPLSLLRGAHSSLLENHLSTNESAYQAPPGDPLRNQRAPLRSHVSDMTILKSNSRPLTHPRFPQSASLNTSQSTRRRSWLGSTKMRNCSRISPLVHSHSRQLYRFLSGLTLRQT